MKRIACVVSVLALAVLAVAADKAPKPEKTPKAGKDGWVRMFDGKTLDGWQATERPENWAVEDGMITGKGDRSHLIWTKEQCENCEFFATAKIATGANSGMYFRIQEIEPGWPKGYEAQVNTSHGDPVKTGSLYNFVKVLEKLVPEEAWFSQHIIANGNHIVIKVNGKTTVDHIESTNKYMKGYLGLQQHDPKSRVWYKDLLFRKIPAKK